MRIVSFSVKNYRSIVEANKINISNLNVLLGRNNEGKSNILRALSVCMSCINDYRRFRYRFSEYSLKNDAIYSWSRDFPIALQNRSKGKKTIFELEIFMDDEELNNFNKKIGTRITSHIIKLKIKIDENNKIDVTFPLKGTNSLTQKKEKVLDFFSDKIYYNYIPAIRTEGQAIRLIKNNIANDLKCLNNNPIYIESLKKIRNLQEERLTEISKNIKKELSEFLPKVKEVKIEIEDDYKIASSISSINVSVDDGVMTNIENKGDGVKSLSVLAMLKNRTSDFGISSIIAIDEPEAHLHSGAINELNNVIKSLSENNQVIISTHNHLFTNYLNIENNLIVDNGKVKPAKNINEIRDILGVKVSDNLVSARFVLLVEGETDKKLLNYVLINKSPIIKKGLSDRIIAIESLDGASKLEFYLNRFKNDLCFPVILLDNDEEGIKHINNVVEKKYIEVANTFLFKCKGMPESELEDCIKPQIYQNILQKNYGVDIKNQVFRNNKKWSKRIEDLFIEYSKPFGEKILCDIKNDVLNECLNEKLENVLIEEKSKTIDLVKEKIEQLLKEL